MKNYFLAFFLFASLDSPAQVSYLGSIDKYLIEMLIKADYDGSVDAVYAYTKYQTPIKLEGTLNKGLLVLQEKGSSGKTNATFTFKGYKASAELVTGTWKSMAKGTEFPITLTRQFNTRSRGEDKTGEVMQATALKDKYFRLVLSIENDLSGCKVTAVKVLEKRTNKLLQEIGVDADFDGINDVEAADYNFDGQQDFSIFDMQHAGPNTTRQYFLYDVKSGKFKASGFEGVSLEFDQEKKLIYETNSCCAGTITQTAIYKVVKDKMVAKEKHCYIYDEKKQDLVEQPLKKCQ